MTFRIGQKVALKCEIKCNPEYGEMMPIFGVAYTIRSFLELDGKVGIRLNEIQNPELLYDNGVCECAFRVDFFRPLVERKTELPASLTALLDPANHVPLKEPV